MAGYTESGSITIDGLGNGTEFAGMIEALKKIEMKHATQLANWRDDWEKRLSAFKEIRAALTDFSTFMKTINSEEKFLVKSVKSSNSNVLDVLDTVGAMDGTYSVNVTSIAKNSYLTVEANIDNRLSKITDSPGTFKYKFDKDGDGTMEEYSIAIGADTTMQGLINQINSDKNNPGVGATLMEMGGKFYFQMYSKETGSTTAIVIDDAATLDLNCFTKDPDGGGVRARHDWADDVGSDAVFSLSGQQLTSSSNDINAYGIKMNLTDTGTTTLVIGTDTAAIKENVEKFVEEINKVRGLLVELTSVNENKVQKDPEYTTSQFDMQMGSVLTGNYGVQLLKSMFNTTTISQGAGFDYLEIDESNATFTGDIFSSLAQIGIKTDHTVGSPTFGMLIFEDNTELITLDKALAQSPAGVAELFSAKKKTYCDGSDFQIMDEYCMFDWVSAGKYDVEYKCDGAGTIEWVEINGQRAKPLSNGLYSLSDAGNKEFGGLTVMINNTAPGTHSGTARVKDGKLNELISLVDQDFLREYNVMDKENNGTLSILEKQYEDIITNIEKKIIKEDERIVKWERTTKLRFSRLEAVLKKYDGLKEQLESQLKQLNSGSD